MRTGELTTQLGNFREIHDFVVNTIESNGASNREKTETLLVFEALYNDMIERGVSPETMVRVRGTSSLGDLTISLGFEGRMFIPMDQMDGEYVEGRVIEAYGDKVESSYYSGFNNLSIRVTRHVSKAMAYNLVAFVMAILTYLLISKAVSRESQLYILKELVFPLEKMYTNAVLMVGAPVTFFSLLRNLTDAYILAAKDSGMRRLQTGTLVTSVISALIALGVAITTGFITGTDSMPGLRIFSDVGASLDETIESLIPSSIFTPFETMSPIPLIVLALLTTYAFCHAGKYFNGIRRVTDACYTLFSRMLSVIVYTVPFFFFLSMLDVMLSEGVALLIQIIALLMMAVTSLAYLAVFYAIRLKLNGIAVMPLVRKMGPLLKENFVINSAIDAVPFNIRYCTINFGMDRKNLEKKLPMLAQLNLDGNCFMITMATMLFISSMGLPVSWFDILVILVLVVFLSMGAPNQPGSMLIGMLIIINYLEAYNMMAVAIYCEVFLGSILNLINVEGDIITAAVEDAKEKRDAANNAA